MEAWFKRLFEGCEFEIMQTAFTALGQPRPGTKEKQAVELATSGSCAIVGMYDHASSKLRVACTGDSRAVLGTRNEAGKGWIAVAMSEDQTGFNKAEIDRVNAEHPGESPISPETGRTLGIAVTRAFGDHLWKWPIDMIKIAAERFDGWKPRPEYHTPPYLTVRPEIKHRTVKDQDFLILASDGFWDHVSNEDAVALVRAWIDARPKKDWISRISMPETAETSETTEQEPLMDTPWRWRFQQKYTTVRDDNAAVHLIRNAFGGNQTAHFEVIMTPDAPQARSFRDDTSVIVVFFDNTTRDTRTYEPVSDEPYWNYYRPAEYFRFPRTLTEDPQVQKVNSK
jgi:pyruvate dehydrogenase phosphatase